MCKRNGTDDDQGEFPDKKKHTMKRERVAREECEVRTGTYPGRAMLAVDGNKKQGDFFFSQPNPPNKPLTPAPGHTPTAFSHTSCDFPPPNLLTADSLLLHLIVESLSTKNLTSE